MKKQLGKRVVSWLLAVGMMLSPVGAGVTAVPSFAEESSIVDTADESTVPTDKNTDSEDTDENTDGNTDTENTDENLSEDSEENDTEIADEEETSSNGGSNETPSLDYINSIPVTINEKISAYYNTDGTNTVDLRTGNFVAVGNSISILLSVNDYINHKVTINGEEIPLYLNDDGFVVFASYTVENIESLNIDLVEAPWSEERLSQYVTLDLGESVYVLYANIYNGNPSDYAANGDYLAKGRGYYINYYYTMFDEDAVLKINGTEVECEINEEYQLANYFFYLPEDADFDTLRVEVVTDNGDIPVTYGEKIRVVCYPPNSEDDTDKTFPSSGSTVSSESYLYIMTDISDAVDHIIIINGSEISLDEWTPSGDGYYLGYGYSIQETDTEIVIELIEKEWTDEYKSQYSVFEISSGLDVYYYNDYLNLIITNYKAQNGDYIHKDGAFAVISTSKKAIENNTITINGEEVEYTINDNGYAQITRYDVPDDSDVIRVAYAPFGDVPISFDDKTITIYHNSMEFWYEDGDKAQIGTKLVIDVELNDYINHKLMLNGEEIPLELTGDGTYFYGNYTVSEEDTQLEFVLEESQWTEEELSDFAVVEIDDYIQLYNYNEYSQTAIVDYPLENGDYIYKGQKIVVRVPYLYYPDKAIIRINGKQMGCYVNNDYEWQIWAYEPYYTDNTLSVKFDNEFSAPITVFGDYDVWSYYSLEDVFSDFANYNSVLTVYVNEPVTVSTLNFPKKLQKLTIDGIGSIKYSGKTLNIPCDTTIGCELITSAAVKVAAGKTLTLESAAKTLGAVSGTATSKLTAKTDVTASGLTTFGEVTVADGKTLTVSGAVKAVGLLNGAIKFTNASTAAAITNIGTAEIILVETNGKLPKTTVTNVNEALAVTVENKTGKLASGTTILYTVKENYSDKVTIKNTTESGDELTAYHYAKTKSIKAEVGTALTLTYDDFEKSYPNFELLFADITDPDVEYIIEVNTDLTLDTKFALPKNAKSITFDGSGTLTFTGTKLTIPYDVTIGNNVTIEVSNKNGTMDIAVGKDATLKNFGVIEGINKLSGTKTSSIEGAFTVANLATFDKVSGEVVVNGGKVTGVNVLDGGLAIVGAKATAAITTVVPGSEIILVKENGVLPKVTLEGVGDKVDEFETIGVTVYNSLDDEAAPDIESGTAILYTKKNNFTDKISITNNNGGMGAFCYGKTIKAEYPDAITVSADPYSEEDDRDYPNFELAVAEIDAAKNSNADYVITIKKDIAPEKFALPKYAASVTLTSEGGTRTINIGKATAIAANTDLTINNVAFATTGKTLTITAKKNLTVNKLYGNVTAVKGAAKFALNWNGENESTAKADITGFGTVNVNGALTTGKNFNVTKLVLANNAKLVVSAATTKSSIKALEASNNCAVSYEEGAKALTFTGKDTDFVLSGDKLTITGEVANGQAVLTTKNVSLTKLANGITPANEYVEYDFVQMGNNICYMGKVLELKNGEFPLEAKAYTLWSDVVSAIEAENNSEAIYTITLLDSYNANAAIKFPKAGTYKFIIITCDDEVNFNFTGNLTLTGSTIIEYVNIGAVKNGAPAKYTINAGKNYIYIMDCDTGLLTSLSGGTVAIGNADADKIKANDLNLMGGNITAAGGITTKNVTISNDTNLVMNQGSKLAITGNVEANSESSKITLTILDKNGNVAALKKGYIVATIKGEYAENSIVLDEAHTGFTLDFVNGKLVVA